MAIKPDYYGILQVHLMAQREVIDVAYRRLAAKYHPDVSHASDATERMKRLNEAYEVLTDPVKRAAYDATLNTAPSPGTSPHAAARSHHASKARRNLLIVTGLILLAIVVFRLGPSFMLLASRLVIPLAVIALVVWLLFTLAKPKR